MGSAPMTFGGFLPEDAPDPRLAQAEKVKLMPVPVMGLVPQLSLDDINMESTMSSHGTSGMSQMAVSISYTLKRNPLDPSDPVNLADLDESARRALDQPPLHPRPAWLIEQVERMRYPLLWEAVRTTWHRDPTVRSTPSYLLVEHANYILMNRFRKELGLGDIGRERFTAGLTERAVNPGATAMVDGTRVPAFEIDTDPFVYAIGVQLARDTVLTAVLPREELQYVRVEFVRRAPRPAAVPST